MPNTPAEPTWYPWSVLAETGVTGGEALSAARWNQMLDNTYYMWEQRVCWYTIFHGRDRRRLTLPAGPALTQMPLYWTNESNGILGSDANIRYPATWMREMFAGSWSRTSAPYPSGDSIIIPTHPSSVDRLTRTEYYLGTQTFTSGHFAGPYLVGAMCRFDGQSGGLAGEEGTIGIEIVGRDASTESWKVVCRRYDELDGTDNLHLQCFTLANMAEGRELAVRIYHSSTTADSTAIGPSDALDNRALDVPSAFNSDLSRIYGAFWGFQFSGWSELGTVNVTIGGE